MVEAKHPQLSIRRQCDLLGVNRNRLDPAPAKTTTEDLRLMRTLDELHMAEPTFGARRMCQVLNRDHGYEVDRKRVGRLMRLMGIAACWPKPRTSLPGAGHKVFPYLLRDMKITQADEVWCADITYIPMAHGYCYLAAVMDWSSRKVLGWAVSTTMDVGLCLEAFRMAVRISGRAPGIMNTDQGSQFTSTDFIKVLAAREIKISMDGKGAWRDNVFVERLWRTIKYEEVYLRAYASVSEARAGIGRYLTFYNGRRPHSSLDGKTPDQAYFNQPMPEAVAA